MDPSSIALDPNTRQLLEMNFNYWFLQSLAMALTAAVLPGLRVTSIFGPVFAVVALGFVNSKVWSTALFFNVPHSLSSEVLILLGANGVIFWTIVKLMPGIEIDGIFAAIAAPVLFTLSSLVIAYYFKDTNWIQVLGSVIEMLGELKTSLETHFPQGSPTPQPSPSELQSFSFFNFRL